MSQLNAYNNYAVPDCGYEFPEKDKHEDKASEKSILSQWKKPQQYKVLDVKYSKHLKKGGSIPSLRVEYFYSLFESFVKYVPIENPKGQFYAKKWLKEVTKENITTVDQAVELSKQSFREPISMLVNENGEYPDIIGFTYDKEIPEPVAEKNKQKLDDALGALL